MVSQVAAVVAEATITGLLHGALREVCTLLPFFSLLWVLAYKLCTNYWRNKVERKAIIITAQKCTKRAITFGE